MLVGAEAPLELTDRILEAQLAPLESSDRFLQDEQLILEARAALGAVPRIVGGRLVGGRNIGLW